jgi:hypothetical protein
VLHSFGYFTLTDGTDPAAGVVLDGAGNLYGTNMGSGRYSAGTVYEITP